MHKPHIVITGSAQGLGRALSDYYTHHGCTVQGWDIVYGLDQDLWNDTTLSRVVDSCRTADIFFNCADIRQVDYLNAVYELWRDRQDCCIVNISTSATYFFDLDQAMDYYKDLPMVEYIRRKKELDHRQKELYLEQLKFKRPGPWLLNIRPSYQTNTIVPDKQNWRLLDQNYLAENIAQIIMDNQRQLVIDCVILAPL